MKNADYGLDAPGVILGALVAGAAITAVAIVVPVLRWLVPVGGLVMAVGAATWWSSRRGKLGLRDHLLDGLRLRGDEAVLDVGCGRGLLLVGAARRLNTGRASGLDLWASKDQLDNRRDATLDNAAAEGVAGRVEVVDGDMRAMPFADGAFDVIVSNLAIHNVPTVEGRRRSIAEIVRVLAPGGRIAIMDLAFTGDYAGWLAEAGITDVRRVWPARWFFPPLGIVTGRKLGGGTDAATAG